MRTDTALYVFVSAYDILETQFPKLSKNTVECHSKKRDKTYVTVLYFLLHSFPIFLYKKKGGQFSKLVSLTPLLLYSRKWSLMTC